MYEVSSVEYAKKNTKNIFKTAINSGRWKKSIVNHLYTSEVSTPNTDGILIVAIVGIEIALTRLNYLGEKMN